MENEGWIRAHLNHLDSLFSERLRFASLCVGLGEVVFQCIGETRSMSKRE